MELPFDPVISLLEIYPKNPETPIQKNICIPVFIAALFTIAKIQKLPRCPSVDEWIKLWGIHTMEYYSAIKKKKILLFVMVQMGQENIMLSEASESGEDKYHMISHVCEI